ncbi:hypothetical protein H310_04196 [Aphanomyces invadans]|uniref:Transposase Tc1-like domain-containing protein n=1 Tax=Aphanomyces invadans TaxID=157072 RepID=A0A024UHV7_9STRA|nr:hypothetical protein H310_04196 [Aphanomyces invadans]ETW05208.1 hypothetical protein H310_04196 [Aphanomyces invadans]|eukprot:XP_008866646.1 hypothetical protein H310_04196 [Aphanomyces invadans]
MDVVFALQDAIQDGKPRLGAIQDTAAREMIQAVPEQNRSTFHDMTNATGISKSILARHFKAGTIERRSSLLKPLVTKDNRLERLAFCGAHVKVNLEALTNLNPCLTSSVGEADAISEDAPCVHLDEKWFNAGMGKRKIYVVPGQDTARRVCKSKRFVPKVMFLAAVARPRPEEASKARSVFGPLRPSRQHSVTHATYRDFVLHQVVPAIKSRFPSKTKRVFLQHDNATPHATIDDGVLTEVTTDGWVFMVRRQPPNSPDLNDLDLGFFASIQAQKYKTFSRSVDDVISSTLRNLTDDEREAILREVLLRRNGSYMTRLPKGFSQELAEKYNCIVSTIRRVFAVAKQQGIGEDNMKVSVARKMKELNNMLQYVHLDVKWLYLTKVSRKYYLVPGKKEPKREYKSKRNITEVMFLCAVARPRYDCVTDKWWDGKIGVLPFVATVEAQRDSVNRKGGTLENKSVVVTKDVYCTVLLEKVLPAIVAKWPQVDNTIKLQHDNDRALSLGWMMSLAPQPPNSLDTNVLDLGFFAAIQSLQQRKSARTIDELVGHVECAFEEHPLVRLNHTFLTLQSCVVETLKLFGGNGYKVPHKSKHKEERNGMLPENVLCPSVVFDAAMVKVDDMTSAEQRRVLAAELEDARCIDELAQALEAVALGDEESYDMITVLGEAGIDPVSVEDYE